MKSNNISRKLRRFEKRFAKQHEGIMSAALDQERNVMVENQRRTAVFTNLEAYVEYWGKGVLPEYIKSEKGQLLTAPESQAFGLAEWHIDAGGYPGWNEAVAFVDQLAQADRTKAFAEEVRSGLLRSIGAALADISKRGRDEENTSHCAAI